MKNRRIISIILTVFLTFSLSGCDFIRGITGDGKSDAGEKSDPGGPAYTSEELYSKLSHAIGSPANLQEDYLPGTFTFTALILSEPDEVDFGDGDVCLFQVACIARRVDDYFLLNMTDIADTPGENTVVIITGKIAGTVYWTEDNKRVEKLEIKAYKIKPCPETNDEPETGAKVRDDFYVYEFLGAHLSPNNVSGNFKVIVLYFNFTNQSDRNARPAPRQFFFYQGDARLGISVAGAKEKSSLALDTTVGIVTETYPGTTSLYYITLKWTAESDGDTLYICKYDDDFKLIVEIAIPILPSLSDWEATVS